MKIKLSVKDKNLVAMCWLLEIVLNSIVKCEASSPVTVPEYKKAMYRQIGELFVDAHNTVKNLNDQFNDEIHKVFDADFQDTLADLTLSVVTLYENMKPEQLVRVMKAAGVTNKEILGICKQVAK